MYSEMTCPYCQKTIDLDFTDDWSYMEDEQVFQKECPECGMVLNVTPHINIDFDLDKCECQGENHVWKPTTTSPKCMTRMCCVHCGEEREPTIEERVEYGIPSVEEFLESLRAETKK